MAIIPDIIAAEFGGALGSKVKRKKNTTQKLRAGAALSQKASRVASKAPEVMVKVTGFGRGSSHVKANLEYITRNGKLELENDRGEIFVGKERVKELYDDWKKDFGDAKRHLNQRDTMHVMLSMPPETDPEAVRNAVRLFAKQNFGKNQEYVFVLHTDEAHPHAHLTVKTLGFDGKRLNPHKIDLQMWREDFAELLREEGVDAEATPRYSRGVVRKAESSVLRHIERGDRTHEPRVSRVKAEKVKEVVENLIAEAKGIPSKSQPWEGKIKERQAETRRAWLSAAAQLEQHDPRLTFNQKEARNERPSYDRLDVTGFERGQRAAALYQSNLEKSGPQASPRALSSVRNVSSLGVVQHRSHPQVLLQSNAPDRVGRDRGSDPEVRRARVGADRVEGRAEGVGGYRAVVEQNKAFATRIRDFVAAMPEVETERDRLKRDLAQRFTRQQDEVLRRGVEGPPVTPLVDADQGVERNQPRQKGRDVER